MVTYLNGSGAPVVLSWCWEPAHWPGGGHEPGAAAFDPGAFDPGAFDAGTPDRLHGVAIAPGAQLTFDEAAPNGPMLEAALAARGMVPA